MVSGMKRNLVARCVVALSMLVATFGLGAAASADAWGSFVFMGGHGTLGSTRLLVSTHLSKPHDLTVTKQGDELIVEDKLDTLVPELPGLCRQVTVHKVRCQGANRLVETRIFGGQHDDRLTFNVPVGPAGGAPRLEIWGGAGNDVLEAGRTVWRSEIWGEGGDDVLRGGDGEDWLRGGPGADIFIGRGGKDIAEEFGGVGIVADIDGAVRDDGGPGEHDTIHTDVEGIGGSAGDDILVANLNVAVGSFGSSLSGKGGNDLLIGGLGHDSLRGGDGNDTLVGGAGKDNLDGDSGNDVVDGGPGPAGSDPDSDLVSGGSGRDTATYATRTDHLYITLDNKYNDGRAGSTAVSGEHDNVSAVETVFGGKNGDTIIATDPASGDVYLSGNEGDDFLHTRDNRAADSVNGGPGRDLCNVDGFPIADTRMNCDW
jgi:Ca2+-binding RTX toxin-like protein